VKCPVDGTELATADREGIPIQYCPRCGGIRLDRGGLEKLVDRHAAEAGSEPKSRRRDDEHERPGESGHADHDRREKRESVLDELLDFH
jgi:Zn-finger nucleic acid-binding protein